MIHLLMLHFYLIYLINMCKRILYVSYIEFLRKFIILLKLKKLIFILLGCISKYDGHSEKILKERKLELCVEKTKIMVFNRIR